MCDLSYEETSTVYKVTRIARARTKHRCDGCGRIIAVGEAYDRHDSLYDGSWTTEEACLECAEALTEFGKAHRFTPSPSTFSEYLSECVGWDEEGKHWEPMRLALNQRIAASKAEVARG